MLRLMRYKVYLKDGSMSGGLEDYIASMKEGQRKIYFLAGNENSNTMDSPFLHVFKGKDVPVLIVENQFDEMVF